jgi:hypothetical protein
VPSSVTMTRETRRKRALLVVNPFSDLLLALAAIAQSRSQR